MTNSNLYSQNFLRYSTNREKMQDNSRPYRSEYRNNSQLNDKPQKFQENVRLSQYIKTNEKIPTKLNSPIKLNIAQDRETKIYEKPLIISPQINSNSFDHTNMLKENDDNQIADNLNVNLNRKHL